MPMKGLATSIQSKSTNMLETGNAEECRRFQVISFFHHFHFQGLLSADRPHFGLVTNADVVP